MSKIDTVPIIRAGLHSFGNLILILGPRATCVLFMLIVVLFDNALRSRDAPADV